MTQRTDTYDPELWQLVPKEPTWPMLDALHVLPDFHGQHIIRHSVDKLPDAYREALRVAPTPPASAQSVEPIGYINSNWPHERRPGWVTKLYADMSPMTARMAVFAVPPPAVGMHGDGYVDAFYKISAALGIGATDKSPQAVFNDIMLPTIQRLVAQSVEQGANSDTVRNAALEEAARAVEHQGRGWVKGSLWGALTNEACARIRALKSKKAA